MLRYAKVVYDLVTKSRGRGVQGNWWAQEEGIYVHTLLQTCTKVAAQPTPMHDKAQGSWLAH